ncbi:MAG: hypothetical protein ETSY2_13110 [Candidatus Entotheonella gemina]|uniref:Uncharacterized protein n=1 Tax=Candidatus Entotheonella gemina TaxID=1429439 RepID=W4MA87_9BACT|nr:MAG: hypothetical protein ETSY2_13110 [Candidatus Entotheonella gemina]
MVFAGLYTPAPAPAADEVKIAIIVPLSGRWARQGELYKGRLGNGGGRDQ